MEGRRQRCRYLIAVVVDDVDDSLGIEAQLGLEEAHPEAARLMRHDDVKLTSSQAGVAEHSVDKAREVPSGQPHDPHAVHPEGVVSRVLRRDEDVGSGAARGDFAEPGSTGVGLESGCEDGGLATRVGL
jgi:hypothetical protein